MTDDADTPNDFEYPDWSNTDRVHNWLNYISEELREIWPSFTRAQKRIIARSAEKMAGNEEWE